MLSDSLQRSFYCCYFYFTETLDNFFKHMRSQTSSVDTLTVPHLSDETSQDLPFPVLLTIILLLLLFIIIIVQMSCLNDAHQTLMWLLESQSVKKARFERATLIMVNMRRVFGVTSKKGKEKYPVTWIESPVTEP